MMKKHRLTGQRSRAVLVQACAGVGLQPLESRTLLTTAGLALDWGGVDTAYEVAVDGRGRIVVTGDSDGTLIMARFTRSGDELAQDASFGTEGGVALDFEPFGIEIQPDGKILLVGDNAEGTLLVARYNENGTPDTTFAGDGTAEFNVAPGAVGNAIALQPDGKIVAAGATLTPAGHNDFLVVRFARNGTLDTSFGSGGFVTTDFNEGGDDVAKGLGVLHDGRIAVGGISDVGGELNYAVARYLPDGSFDATLDGSSGDGNGRVSGPMTSPVDEQNYMVTDFGTFPGGNMTLLGEHNDDGLIYPLMSDGRLDRDAILPLFRSGPHDELDIDGYEDTYASTWHDEGTATEDNHNHDFSPGYDFGGDDLNGLEFDEYVLGVAVREGNFAAVGYSGEDWAMTLSDVVAIQGPYSGAWHEPGQTIQAEDFDFGGEGVSYHDADAVNRGGEYRVSGVDVGFTSDTGGGFAVGWTQAGEWLEYTIDVPETGTYRFETRVANPAAGARFHYEINGTNLTGSMSVPATGGWHSFATVPSGIVNLTAGQHALRLAMDANASNGAIGNINWLRFTQIDDGGGGEVPGGDGDGPLDETFGGGDGVQQVGTVTPADLGVEVTTAVGPNREIVTAAGNVLTRRLANGEVDTGFGGGDGVLETDFSQIGDVAIQPDGKIVVVGHQNNVFRVARYTPTGQLDTTFSGDGITSRGFGGQPGRDFATGVAIQRDVKIVVVGAGTTGRNPTDTGVVVVRYNANGSIDTTFDNDGYSVEQLSTFNEIATDVAIDSNGRIVVTSFESTPRYEGTVFRYNANGSFDTSFSGDGRATVPFNPNALDILSDNRIVLGGVDFESMADIGDRVARLTVNGVLDTTFGGGDGIVENGLSFDEAYSSVVNDVLVLNDGDIVATGWNEDRGLDELYAVVTRLNGDGSVDTRFTGGAGNFYVTVPFASKATAGALALQDDELIVAGQSNGQHILLARYLLGDDGGGGGGGGLDESFDGDGVVIGPTDDAEVRPVTVAAAPQGKIVAAGGDLITRRLADGSLDATFGNNGILDTDFRYINDIAVRSDGRIVAVGTSPTGGFRIARYTTTGHLDTTFSGDGILTRSFGGNPANDYATAVVIQPDGRIVVVGAATTASRPNDTGVAVTRFTPSGAIDSTFDGDGYSIEQLSTFNEYATDVELDSNGRIVVSGNESTPRFEATVFRYNANGSFDTTFSGDGRTTVPFNVNGIDVQSDNRIVVGGVDQESMADVGDRVARLTVSGALDTTFGGGDGFVENVFAVNNAYSSVVNEVLVLADGDIAVAGWNEDRATGAHDAVVTRLNADGSLDDSLAGEGNRYAIVPFSNLSEADSLVVQDGKLVVGGNRDGRTIAIARYLLDDGGGTPTDTQKPTMPGNLRAQASYDRVTLSWTASTDNVGVTSYEILRNDQRIAIVPGNQTTFTDTNVLPDNGYGYSVFAIDAAGNRSDEAFVNITTPPAPGTGLRGVYYSNMDFTGTSMTRTDAAVNFNWGTGGPSSTIGTDTFSVRWTGRVQAEKTERYTFYTRTDDGVRLWVNGQLLIDRWVPQSATEWSGSIDLRVGQMYTIRMEYFERFGNALAELRWSSPTTPKQVVPTSRLYSET